MEAGEVSIGGAESRAQQAGFGVPTRGAALRDPGAWLIAAQLPLVAVLAAWWARGGAGMQASELITVPGALATTALALRVRSDPRADPGTRRAWSIATAAFAVYLSGTLIGVAGSAIGGDATLSTVARIVRMGWVPLTAWGLAALPRDSQTRPALAQFLLDLTIVAWGTGMVLWHFVLYPAAEQSGAGFTTVALNVVFPAGDLCITFAVIAVALRRVAPSSRRAVLVLVPGLALAFASDMIASVQSIEGDASPDGLVGLLRASAWVVFGLAALVQARTLGQEEPRRGPRVPARPLAWLPYTAIAIAFLAPAIRSWDNPDMLRQHVPATAILFALVLARLAVTARQQEDVATAERGRLAAAVEQAAELITMTDSAGILTYVNPAFTQITGYDAAEVVGRRIGPLLSMPIEDDVVAALSRGEAWSGRLSDRRKDGSPVEIDLVISPLRDPSGTRVGAVTVGRDVSRERALEAQLGQARRLEAVGRLAGGIAHDFNNILTAIRGFGELAVSESSADSPVAADVGEILKAADRASLLTRQLLAFGGRQTMQARVVDVNDVVREIVPMLGRLIGEDIELVTRTDARLGHTMADRAQLEQVIVNLVVNARDAMPGGGTLTIETANADLGPEYARMHSDGAAGPHVMLAVSDTGNGMSPEVLEHAFEPFYTTKAPGKGTGLGLSTVFGIVQRSSGWVHAYSEPGHGTTIRVYLPRVERAAEPRTGPHAPRASLGGGETVLVVEDEDAVRRLAERVLDQAGYRVIVADGGPAALDLASGAGHIDVLFSDVVMPGMSGPDLAERLTAERPGLRVVFASGYTPEAIVQRGMMDGHARLLVKPYTPEALLHTLREVLDEEAGREPDALTHR